MGLVTFARLSLGALARPARAEHHEMREREIDDERHADRDDLAGPGGDMRQLDQAPDRRRVRQEAGELRKREAEIAAEAEAAAGLRGEGDRRDTNVGGG